MSSASEELVETGRQMARLVSESAELEEEELREGGLSGEKSARLVLAYLGISALRLLTSRLRHNTTSAVSKRCPEEWLSVRSKGVARIWFREEGG